jgi:hypothetical protein
MFLYHYTGMSDYRWGLDRLLDLLNTYTHISHLQVTITLSLIHALLFSLQHMLNLSFFTSRFRATDPDSIFCLRPYPADKYPTTD